MRQCRRSISVARRAIYSRKIARRVAAHPLIQAAGTVALFLSFDGEADTTPVIERLWQQKKQLCLPALHPFCYGNLFFLRYSAATVLVMNRLKIPQPVLDVRQLLSLAQIDIVLTPLVAFNCHGQRLGMGGGFYDRTLQNWQRDGPYPIGLAYDCQQVEYFPVQPWDVPLAGVITPSRVWCWR